MSETPAIYNPGPPGVPVAWIGPGPAPAKPAAPSAWGKPARKVKAKAKKDKPRPVRYGPGHYSPAPNGRGFDCSVSLGGERLRARMPDEASARAWIDATEASAADSLPPLTRAQLIDARHALSLLPGGATLADAARAWVSANSAPASCETLGACAARYLAVRGGSLRPSTRASYVQFLGRLRRGLPDGLPVSGVTPRGIESVLAGLTPHNRNNALRVWSAFFRWASGEGACAGDPCARAARARLPEPPKGVITPAQAGAVMACAAARRPDMVPYLALAFFAGIRPEELRRLRPEKIGASYILLDGSVTKTASTRSVEIRPNLAAWLSAYPPALGRCVPPLAKKRLYLAMRAIREDTLALASETGDASLAVPSWPPDCARHCFATYMYELTKDAAAVAAEMGHKGVDVFFAHYRALSLPGDGQRYSGITPGSVAKLTTVCQRFL